MKAYEVRETTGLDGCSILSLHCLKIVISIAT
jgi:hypothetical protein